MTLDEKPDIVPSRVLASIEFEWVRSYTSPSGVKDTDVGGDAMTAVRMMREAAAGSTASCFRRRDGRTTAMRTTSRLPPPAFERVRLSE